jgi:C4-dicarboxylate-specific signal transduction histidine kinase
MSPTEIAILLADPPGNLIYHFAVAMALGVILSLALIYQSRLKNDLYQRIIMISGALLACRFILLFLDGLIFFDVIEINNPIAAADRFITLFTLLAFTWFLGLPTPKYNRWFLIVGLALIFLILVASPKIIQGPSESDPLNKTNFDIAWSFVSLIISLSVAISLVTLRPRGWDFAVSPYAIISLGILLHITYGPKIAFAAGYVRFAEIAAYPLFAILTARTLASSQADIVYEAKELFKEPSSLEVTTLMVAISDLATLFTSTDQTQLANNAVQITAKRMNSDYCLLIIPNETDGKLVIAAGFDLFQDHHLPKTSLSSKKLPIIVDALQHSKSLIIQKEFSAHELRALQPILSQEISGPTLFVPLSSGQRVLGGFLLISHSARQLWSTKDREAMELLSSLLFQRFQELKRSEDRADKREVYEQKTRDEQRIKVLEQEKQHLEEALEAYRTRDSSVPQEDLQSLLNMHENDQKEIDRLKSEINDLRDVHEAQEEPPKSDALEQLVGERLVALQELAETRESLSKIEREIETTPEGRSELAPDTEAILAIVQELRQPMSSIYGYTDLLLSESVGLLGAMQQKFLERIRNASDRMGSILNNLMRLSAGEVKALSFAPGPVEVMHCLEDAIAQVQQKMQEKNITLRMDIPENSFTLHGDEDSVIQIFYHLLDNAIGASPEDGEVIVIMREQEADPNKFLMISVADSGEGIPAKDIQRVFQRTYSGDKVTIQGISDEGIGLSMVKSMSENLGGRVWVDSEIGEGSVFTLLLPMTNG